MKRVQIFLTVQAGKWMIAQAIAGLDEVQAALRRGTLALKAGTTTSCLSWLLTGRHLRLCGRMTPRGAVAALKESQAPHTVLLGGGGMTSLDGREREGLLALGPEGVLVTGANLIDCQGNAAMLAGSPGGGTYGAALGAIMAEGMRVLIAAGTEKLTPGTVPLAVQQAQRKGVEASWGMACGLIPVAGTVITEVDAIRMLAPVQAVLMGKGGVCGAEGGSLLQVWGEDGDVDRIWALAKQCLDDPMSGTEESLAECRPGARGCGEHLACVHRKGQPPGETAGERGAAAP